MAYHTLLINDGAINNEPASRWTIQFGDRDRELVRLEATEAWRDVPRKHRKIITTRTSRQAEIDAAVARLNAGAGQ